MMAVMEPTVLEGAVVKMEDIFRDLHQEGQQTNMASPEVANGEGVEPIATTIKEVTADRGQEGSQVERASPRNILLPCGDGPSSVPDISPRHRSYIIFSPLCQAVVCQGCQPSMGAPAPDHLSDDNRSFFEELLPMPNDMEPFYDRVLSF